MFSSRKLRGTHFALAALLAGSLIQIATTATAAPPAAFTGTNTAVDGPGTCLNGPGDVNCNIYTSKNAVWLNAGPLGTSTGFGPGTYFFAVSVPGSVGQNDGNVNNLSDLSPTTNTGAGDAFTNRIFKVTGATATYSGTHDATGDGTSALKIRVMPYDDTTNSGGEYQISICRLEPPLFLQPVTSSACKNDNFKIASSTSTRDLTVAKTAFPAFTRTYTWTLKKSVDTKLQNVPSGTNGTFGYTVVADKTTNDSAWALSGTITIANPTDFATSATVTDQVRSTDLVTADPSATCTVTGGATVAVPANSSVDVAYTCTYSAAPAAVNQINHVAIAWSGFGTGTASFDKPFDWTIPTEVGSNCVNVTDNFNSTGAVALSPANICDDHTYTYKREITGVPGTCTVYPNTASIDTVPAITASQEVKLCVGKDLTVSKTAAVDYVRTYTWKIEKAVDKILQKIAAGSATFNYTVTSTQTGVLDSAFSATGKITVSNPNDWESITLTGLTDMVDNGGSCSLLTPGPYVVAASSSIVVDYKCTYASKPANGTNTAKATWDAAVAATPTGTASGTAAVTVGLPSKTINKTITVTDAFNGGAATTLGTATATDTAPFTVKTFNYPRQIAVAAGCVKYPNTASIVETGATASQTVTVCGPLQLGALTMGFWQNKNGQAIINGGIATAGVCNSGTWLRQYAPFQDLSPTANCAAVASYVTGVIKNASAAGAAMNAMLKAQMLATALDVYFSDPGLGGNKIGAPAPIGGITIDLTTVCKDLATCLVYENTSTAFGGATSATVSALLNFAAGQSNIGGSVWYGQVKATQELAKDTFDAINNNKVFAP